MEKSSEAREWRCEMNDDTYWRNRAACKNLDAESEGFFSIGMEKQAARAALNAIAVCERCPVIEPCLTEARLHGDCGVRGGVLRPEPGPKGRQQEVTAQELSALLGYRAQGGSGPCPECGRRQRLRHNGGVYQHWNPAVDDWCPGSGELPTREAAS